MLSRSPTIVSLKVSLDIDTPEPLAS